MPSGYLYTTVCSTQRKLVTGMSRTAVGGRAKTEQMRLESTGKYLAVYSSVFFYVDVRPVTRAGTNEVKLRSDNGSATHCKSGPLKLFTPRRVRMELLIKRTILTTNNVA